MLETVYPIRVMNVLSAHYRDPRLMFGMWIGATDFATLYSSIGGNVLQSLVNQVCLDI